MSITNQFLFFFSIVGAFNGLIVGMYFIFQNKKFKPNLFSADELENILSNVL